MFLLIMLTGCLDPLVTEIELSGTLTENQDSSADPVADGEVATFTIYGEEVDCALSNSDGSFTVTAPASSNFFVLTDATGRVPTTFTGWSGIEDETLEPGTLWVRDESELDTIRSEFEGCEGSDSDGAVVEGRIRVYLPVDEPVDELPIVTTASVEVMDENGNTTAGCYLDDEGISNPEASQTGETGRFAVFGLPSGPAWVTVNYTASSDMEETIDYPILLPTDGTAPMYPLLVDLP